MRLSRRSSSGQFYLHSPHLLLVYGINGVAIVAGSMKAVDHNRGIGQHFTHGAAIPVPHVDAHRLR
jgi:hypothetical protein